MARPYPYLLDVFQPTYQMPLVSSLGDISIVASPANAPEPHFGDNMSDAQPITQPEDVAINMLLASVLHQEPSNSQETDYLIKSIFNVRSTLVSPQESVLFKYYRPERPIAIVRTVLMLPTKPTDNS